MGLEFRIAQTEEELKMAFQVRYAVFGEDCGYLKAEDYPDQIESDKYDFLETTKNFIALDQGKPIATARLSMKDPLIADEEETHFGLPVEHIFDLAACKKLGINVGEISRSAVLGEYRRSRTIMTIWGCIIGFAKEYGLTHIVTNANMETDCMDNAMVIYELAKKEGYVHQDIITPPLEEFAQKQKKRSAVLNSPVEIPEILQMYARIGTKFISPPIYYSKFNMCSILVILDFEKINEPCKTYFERSWKRFNKK